MRALIGYTLEEQAERSRLADTFGALPHAAVRKLFEDYIEEKFDVHLHSFFARLYDGVISMLRSTLSARMDIMEEHMRDLKRSTLMAAIHPYAWVESEIVGAVAEYLRIQPGGTAGLHHIYRHIAFDERLPLPGATLVEKYQYILRLLRGSERFREVGGFMFEMTDHKVVEEKEELASSDSYRDSEALMAMLNDAVEGSGS